MSVSNFVLCNLPATYSKATIKDIVEGTLDVDVKDVNTHEALPGTALITLDCKIDFTEASELLQESPIEEHIIEVKKTKKRPSTVVVRDVEPCYLSEQFLRIYFCVQFGNGKDIVSSCYIAQNLRMAFVKFHKNNIAVMNRIFAHIHNDQVHLPLKDFYVSVEPFYSNFHGCLRKLAQHRDNTEAQTQTTNEVLDPDASIGDKTHTTHEVLDPDASIGDKTQTTHEVLDPHASIRDKTQRTHQVLNPHASIGDKTQRTHQVLNPHASIGDKTQRTHQVLDPHASIGDKTQRTHQVLNPHASIGDKTQRTHQVLDPHASIGDKTQRTHQVLDPHASIGDKTQRTHQVLDPHASIRDKTQRTHQVLDPHASIGDKTQRTHQVLDPHASIGDKTQRTHQVLDPHASIGDKTQRTHQVLDPHASIGDKTQRTHQVLDPHASIGDKTQRTHQVLDPHASIGDKTQRTHQVLDPHASIRDKTQRTHQVLNPHASIGDKTQRTHQVLNPHASIGDKTQRTHQVLDPHASIGDKTQRTHQVLDPHASIGNKTQRTHQVLDPHASIGDKTQRTHQVLDPHASIGDKTQRTHQVLDPHASIGDKTQRTHQVLDPHASIGDKTQTTHDAFKNNKAEMEKRSMLPSEMKEKKEKAVELTAAMKEILSTLWQQQCLEKIRKLISSKGCELLFENFIMKILTNDEDNLQSCLEIVKAEISGAKLIVPQGSMADSDFPNLKAFTECKYPVIVSMQRDKILVQGMKEEVGKAAMSIEDRLLTLVNVVEKFEVVGPQAEYIHHALLDKMLTLLKDVTIIDQKSSDKKVTIVVEGRRPQVDTAMDSLNGLLSSTHFKTWDLRSEFHRKEDYMLVSNSHQRSQLLKLSINQFEKENQCFVSFNYPTVPEVSSAHSASRGLKLLWRSMFSLMTLVIYALSCLTFYPCQAVSHCYQSISKSSKFQQSANVSSSSTFAGTQQPDINITEEEDKEEEKPLVYKLTDTCKLIIKSSASITQESSEVLVCLLDDNVDPRRTRVGSDFNKSAPSLWKHLSKAQKEKSPDTPVLVTKGPFPGLPQSCQAVYHVILPKWSPGSSEAKLKQVIHMLVIQAAIAGMTSISIPPLGCGRALGFPSATVAQITMQSLLYVTERSSLKRVILLAGDPALLADYIREAQKIFPSMDSARSDEAGTSGGDSNASETCDSNEDKEKSNAIFEHKGPDSVTIWATKNHSLDRLWSKLRRIFIAGCLHEEFFSQSEFEIWPEHFCEQIASKAKENSVWVEASKGPRSNMSRFLVKGEKHAVEKMMEIIRFDLKCLVDSIPKRIASNTAPKRGTLEFLQHAASCTERFPSYWKLSKNETKETEFLGGESRESKQIFADVDAETKRAIIRLVSQDLFDPSRVGHGSDARNLNHMGIKVVNVKRVENPALFELYNHRRKQLFEDRCRQKKICTAIEQIPGSKGCVRTTEKLPDFMKEELYWEVNEHYLFHGSENIKTLVYSGPDPRVGNGMFGKGLYLTESATKADQYVDKKNRVPNGTTLAMILFRTLLGNPYLCHDRHQSVQFRDSKKLIRPPCVHCEMDFCTCTNQTLYDSVMGDGKWLFREFVLYEQHRCYPEYVITYKRF